MRKYITKATLDEKKDNNKKPFFMNIKSPFTKSTNTPQTIPSLPPKDPSSKKTQTITSDKPAIQSTAKSFDNPVAAEKSEAIPQTVKGPVIKEGPKQREYSQLERDKAVIEVRDLVKNFYVGTQEINVLKGINVQINQGDFLVILGPSGCGKSTLLHTLLGLEFPTSGIIKFLGKNIYENTTEDDRTQYRKEHVGMIYQQPNWIKSMTVIENVAFPLILRGYQKEMAHDIAHEALDLVHMTQWESQIPTELSGGQQQRVAVARCVVHNPEVIVADEPTGNLDYESGIEVMELLQRMNVENKKTMIMVTHDIEYVKYATCAIRVFDGRILGYFTKDNMHELMSQLQTKRVDKSQLEDNSK